MKAFGNIVVFLALEEKGLKYWRNSIDKLFKTNLDKELLYQEIIRITERFFEKTRDFEKTIKKIVMEQDDIDVKSLYNNYKDVVPYNLFNLIIGLKRNIHLYYFLSSTMNNFVKNIGIFHLSNILQRGYTYWALESSLLKITPLPLYNYVVNSMNTGFPIKRTENGKAILYIFKVKNSTLNLKGIKEGSIKTVNTILKPREKLTSFDIKVPKYIQDIIDIIVKKTRNVRSSLVNILTESGIEIIKHYGNKLRGLPLNHRSSNFKKDEILTLEEIIKKEFGEKIPEEFVRRIKMEYFKGFEGRIRIPVESLRRMNKLKDSLKLNVPRTSLARIIITVGLLKYLKASDTSL